MSSQQHEYTVRTVWTGNRGTGTDSYRSYGRDGLLSAPGKHEIAASSDRVFHGDAERWNPEELLLAALSECHMLSFLHVAVLHKVVVTAYTDEATGTLHTHPDGSGEFSSVILRPRVTYQEAITDALAAALHHEAGEMCFIARSVNFPVHHEPTVDIVGL